MSGALSLAELLSGALDSRLVDLHTAMPARVESYDAAKQTVDVLPQLKRLLPSVDGETVAETLPVIPNVPVAFPRGGGYFMSFPLKKGDFVFLVFAERALTTWRSKGEAANPVDRRLHPLTGAVALPCVYPDGKALTSADGSDFVLGKDGAGGALARFKDNGDIVLNGGVKGVARVGDGTVGHVHTVTGTAGPYPIASGTAVTATDSIAENGVKVKA